MEDWAEIRRLYRSEKLSQAEIARRLKLSRNTVAKAVGSESPPSDERAPVASSGWLAVEPAVRALLREYPTMAARRNETPRTGLAHEKRSVSGAINEKFG